MPIISRTTFEPGDDLYFDEEGNAIPDSGFREAFKIAPGLPDFINAVREQGRKEGYELGQSEAFRTWRPEKTKQPAGRTGEQHFSSKDLASKWDVSEQTIRNIFAEEPDVLRYGNSATSRSRRKYVNMKIPQSVAERVHKRLSTVKR